MNVEKRTKVFIDFEMEEALQFLGELQGHCNAREVKSDSIMDKLCIHLADELSDV